MCGLNSYFQEKSSKRGLKVEIVKYANELDLVLLSREIL